ncbi:MAG: NUDIX domain-containing protein [Bacteroidota bacterium]
MTRKTIKVRLILEHRGFILMLKQTSMNGGKYTLIGGTLEDGELPKETLIRESKEESGITLIEEDLQLVHTLFKRKENELRIVMYFKASRWKGQIESREPDKFKRVSWLPLDDLPKNTSPTVKHVLAEYGNGESYSVYRKSP